MRALALEPARVLRAGKGLPAYMRRLVRGRLQERHGFLVGHRGVRAAHACTQGGCTRMHVEAYMHMDVHASEATRSRRKWQRAPVLKPRRDLQTR
jgi:hypothetical protein